MVIFPRIVPQLPLILHGQRLWEVGIDSGVFVSMMMRCHVHLSMSNQPSPPGAANQSLHAMMEIEPATNRRILLNNGCDGVLN